MSERLLSPLPWVLSGCPLLHGWLRAPSCGSISRGWLSPLFRGLLCPLECPCPVVEPWLRCRGLPCPLSHGCPCPLSPAVSLVPIARGSFVLSPVAAKGTSPLPWGALSPLPVGGLVPWARPWRVSPPRAGSGSAPVAADGKGKAKAGAGAALSLSPPRLGPRQGGGGAGPGRGVAERRWRSRGGRCG